ncbi:MAG: hypothetical protein GX493_07945 [Firmicutes bacterium]|nr:hypothetical protein [Bacillota bacterium]
MGLFGKKNPYKKYEDLFFAATKMGQSVEYAFKQAVNAGITDKAFADQAEASQKLYESLLPRVDYEQKAPLEKAYQKLKEA